MSIDERNEKATSFWQMLKNTNVKFLQSNEIMHKAELMNQQKKYVKTF